MCTHNVAIQLFSHRINLALAQSPIVSVGQAMSRCHVREGDLPGTYSKAAGPRKTQPFPVNFYHLENF